LAAVEIVRRAQWNIFRVENEQINNVGKFRAVKEIPIPLEKVKLYPNFLYFQWLMFSDTNATDSSILVWKVCPLEAFLTNKSKLFILN
jgi:hypothetical protein